MLRDLVFLYDDEAVEVVGEDEDGQHDEEAPEQVERTKAAKLKHKWLILAHFLSLDKLLTAQGVSIAQR